MIVAMVAILCFALFMIVSVRHFFVQLLGIKLLLDALVLLLCCARSPEVSAVMAQTAAVLVSALSALVIFVLMAAGIQRFARPTQTDLKVPCD